MTAVDFSSAFLPIPQFQPRPAWLRPVAFVVIAAMRAAVLIGFAAYRPAPPPPGGAFFTSTTIRFTMP